MKRCPKCGNEHFEVTRHVTQTVIVDKNGYYEQTVASCQEIMHDADDDDIWNCTSCGHSAPGREFNIPEP